MSRTETLGRAGLLAGLVGLALAVAGCAVEKAASRPVDFQAEPPRAGPLPGDARHHEPAPHTRGNIQTVGFVEVVPDDATRAREELPSVRPRRVESFGIDLPTALRLAGADNLQIAFAAERVEEALARVDAADVLWVPSINVGVVYNNHAGRIQATEGNVTEASRGSLFVGAGAVTADSPVAGGSGGPARMFVDLPIVDVLFEPLAARQVAQAAQASRTATINDTLLATSLAYVELLRAHARIAVADEAVTHAEELARLTADFARSGQGLQADADRARAELAGRRREAIQARETAAVASAELARILRLDPATRLIPAEPRPARLQLVKGDADVYDLIGQAHALRPELAGSSAALQETWYRTRQEQWRPFLPHLYAGFSAGGFGGAPNSSINNFGDRTDFDLGVVWRLQNLGRGNRALRDERDSLHRQAHVAIDQMRDQVAMEVTQAYEQVHYREQQIAIAEEQVRSAAEALKLNLDGIRGGVLRPIEIQQAIAALVTARRGYLDAVIDYNRAQFALLRAIGQPATEADTENP